MIRYGIWLNQREAVLVKLDGEGEDLASNVERLASEVEGHHKATGGTRGRTPFLQRSGAGAEEKKLSERREQELQSFFKRIIGKIKKAHSVAIFGPGPVKSRFEKELKAHKEILVQVHAVQKADQMTEAQIVARTRKIYNETPNRRLPVLHGTTRSKR